MQKAGDDSSQCYPFAQSVNQILDFRKIDRNKEKLTLSHIDIVSFVDNICTSFRTLANSKVTLAFDSTMPSLQMSFDADKVGKIVNNLLSNAYKFTPMEALSPFL